MIDFTVSVEFFRRIIYNRNMKDLIEERNKKEKMQHSIVKWWNVHYMTPEELAEEQEKEEASALSQAEHVSAPSGSSDDRTAESPAAESETDEAQEILERLGREAEEDEVRKREEIAQVRLAAEANFNEATGAYSGGYGASGASNEHKEKIDAILAEKDDALRSLIESTEEE